MSITFFTQQDEQDGDEFGTWGMHEVNLSETNAKAFLNALRIPYDPNGATIAKSEFPDLSRRLIDIINRRSAQSGLLLQDEHVGILYSFGRTVEYVIRTAIRFLGLIQYAQITKQDIHWG